MTIELTQYRVIGKIKAAQEEYCDCPHCDGHGEHSITDEVDFIVEAGDEEHAKNLAQLQYDSEGDEKFREWIEVWVLFPGEKPPRPRELELTLLERWNTGQGLPLEVLPL